MIEITRPTTITPASVNDLSNEDSLNILLCQFVDNSPGMLEARWYPNTENPNKLVNWFFYPNWQLTSDESLDRIILASASLQVTKHAIHAIGYLTTDNAYMGYKQFGIKIANENIGAAGEAFYSYRGTGGFWVRIISYDKFTLGDN